MPRQMSTAPRQLLIAHCSAQERLKHYRGDVGSGMPRYQHFGESARILAMLENGSVPIRVRFLHTRSATLFPCIACMAASVRLTLCAMLRCSLLRCQLLLRLLKLSTAMLRRAECRVLRGDAMAREEAPKEAEDVRLISKGPGPDTTHYDRSDSIQL